MAESRATDGSNPGEPEVRSPDGVDLTLIRWMLSLTPGERLGVLEDWANGVLEIRELNESK